MQRTRIENEANAVGARAFRRALRGSASLMLAALPLGGELAQAKASPPDNFDATAKLRAEYTVAENAPVSVTLTTKDESGKESTITNKDGSVVTYSQRSGKDGKVTFIIPEQVNGKAVNDVHGCFGKSTDPLDPGCASETVFSNGALTDSSLYSWLSSNGYTSSAAGIVVPDFLTSSFTELDYGVDYATLGSAGASFVAAFPVGTTFTIDSTGVRIPQLPEFLFSQSPIVYTAGVGWSGTPLPPGTQVQLMGFHTVAAEFAPTDAPLPAWSIVALASALLGIVALRRDPALSSSS